MSDEDIYNREFSIGYLINSNLDIELFKLLDELNEVWLFDVGEATQHQILKTNIRPRKVTRIFISHTHGDHIFGLPGFLSSG